MERHTVVSRDEWLDARHALLAREKELTRLRDQLSALYHSMFGREAQAGCTEYLDLVPKGRDEAGLCFPMAWVRHHDAY